MPTQVQFRRGTSTQNDSFTGANGEISVDLTNNTLRVHDGVTEGGHALAPANNPVFTGNVSVGNVNITTDEISVGNSSVNTQIIAGNVYLNGSTLVIGNTSSNITVNSTAISIGGLATINSSAIALGDTVIGGDVISANQVYTNQLELVANNGEYRLVNTDASHIHLQTGGNGVGIEVYLPDATTLANGWMYDFNNNANGSLQVHTNGNNFLSNISFGSFTTYILVDNSTTEGTWDWHSATPNTVSWSPGLLNLNSSNLVNVGRATANIVNVRGSFNVLLPNGEYGYMTANTTGVFVNGTINATSITSDMITVNGSISSNSLYTNTISTNAITTNTISVNVITPVNVYSTFTNALSVNTNSLKANTANIISLNVSNDVNISGNLYVTGDTVSLNVSTLDVKDLNITIAKGAPNPAAADGAGITIDGASANILYSSGSNAFSVSHPIKIGGGATINSTAFTGDAATVGGNTASTLRTYSDDKAANAYSNAVSYTDGKILTANSAITGNAATAYTNAVSYTDTAIGTANAAITGNSATAYSNAVSYTDSKVLTVNNAITSNAATAYANATSYTDAKILTANGAITANAATAYSNAIATAATDASNKTATAYSNATAYADTKAATAYSNATSYADTVSGTAYSNAVSTAAGDATSKAATAYSNAIATAATDASSKAATAYSNATAYADTKAATAYSNATAYADTKAATAYSNATSYTDAKILTANGAITGNAATAYSNAVSYVDGKILTANGAITGNAATAYTNAVSYADTTFQTKADLNANIAAYLVNGADKTITGTNITLNGNVIINGNTQYFTSNNVTYADSLIELHAPGANVANTWTYDDGNDVGFRMHYYSGSDKNAALVLANDTKYLEFYSDGTEALGKFTGTYGTIRANNFIGTANNATYLNGQLAAYYTNATNITTGTLPYAQLGTNVINTTANFTITGVQTYNANIILGTTTGISANGVYGTAGQALTTNGSAVYWSTIVGTNTAAQYTWSNTQTFQNTITFSTSILANTVNATSYTTGATGLGTGGLIANVTTVFLGNNTINAALTSAGLTVGGTSTIANTTGVYTGTVNATSLTTGAGYGTVGGGISVNSTAVAIGTSTVNATINSTVFSGTANNASYLGGTAASGYQTTAGLSSNVATLTANNATNLGGVAAASYQLNSTLNANIASYLPTYTGVVNASSHTTGGGYGTVTGGAVVNTTTIAVGNSTVNAIINSTAFTGAANNASYLGGTAASGYQTTAGLSANVATLSANNASYLGGTAAASYAKSADVHYIGTTSIALNRSSASQSLTGVSIDGTANNATYAYGKTEGNLNANSATYATSIASVSATGSTNFSVGGLVYSANGTSGRTYETHDFNSYPNLYSAIFINPTGSSNIPSGVTQMSYRFVMGTGDTGTRGFDLLGVANSTEPGLWYRERSIGTWWKTIAANTSGVAVANGSFRAPIFYDSNDTGYYTDQASSSYYNVVGAAGRFYTGYDSGLTNSMSCSNWFRSNGGTGWYNASYDGGIYMTDSTWVRVYNNKQFYSQNYIQSDSSVRGPIFYDSNDTGYYCDPNSTSRFAAINQNTNTWNYSSESWARTHYSNGDGTIFRGGSTGQWTFQFQNHNDGGTRWLMAHGGDFYASGNVTAYWSDKRLKKNIEKIEDWKQILNSINGYRFQWNDIGKKMLSREDDNIEVGLIAQEVKEAFPQAAAIQMLQYKDNKDGVLIPKDGINYDPENPYLTVREEKFIPVLVEGVKGLMAEIEELKEKIKKMENIISLMN